MSFYYNNFYSWGNWSDSVMDPVDNDYITTWCIIHWVIKSILLFQMTRFLWLTFVLQILCVEYLQWNKFLREPEFCRNFFLPGTFFCGSREKWKTKKKKPAKTAKNRTRKKLVPHGRQKSEINISFSLHNDQDVPQLHYDHTWKLKSNAKILHGLHSLYAQPVRAWTVRERQARQRAWTAGSSRHFEPPYLPFFFVHAATNMTKFQHVLFVKQGNVLTWNFSWFSRFVSLGPVVQKPVNANLGLKVNQGLCFSF